MLIITLIIFRYLLVAQMVKIFLQSREFGFYLWVGKTLGEGLINLLQYSCIENPMDRRALKGYSAEDHTDLDLTEETACMHSYVTF